MKILSVHFQNINSLKGKHKIDFAKSPFAEAGLFAITGPTGAGKTSILDAITVALYGKAARYDNDKPDELMTRHTAESFSEVEFEVNQKSYRAKWGLRRARGKIGGALQSVHHSLVDLETDKAVQGTGTATRAKKKIEHLIGLKYESFRKSVLLAQGDFAAFLQAKENERGELLERITGTDTYSKISEAAYQRAKDEKLKTEKLQLQLGQVVLLSAEDKAVLQLEIKQKEDTSLFLRKEIEGYQLQIQWLKKLEELEGKAHLLQEQKTLLQSQRQALQSDFTQLQFHRRALPFQGDLQDWKNRHQLLQELHRTIHHIRETILPKLRLEKDAAFQQEVAAKKNLYAAKEHQEKTEPIIEEVLKLENEMILQQTALQKEQAKLRDLQRDLQQNQAEQRKWKRQKENTEKAWKNTLKWLEDHQVDKDLSIDIPLIQQQLAYWQASEKEVLMQKRLVNKKQAARSKEQESKEAWTQKVRYYQADLDKKTVALSKLQVEQSQSPEREILEETLLQLQPTIPQLGQQIELANDYQKRQQRIAALRQKYLENRTFLKQLEEARKQFEADLEQGETLLEKLERLYEAERTIESLANKRKLLEPGKPCHLCGSKHHPYAEGKYQTDVSKRRKEFNTQKKKVEQLKKEIATKNQDLARVETEQKNTEDRGKNLSLENNEVLDKFKAINQALKKNYEIQSIAPIETAQKHQQQLMGDTKKQLIRVKKRETEISKLDKSVQFHNEALLKAQNEWEKAEESFNRLGKELQSETAKLNNLQSQSHEKEAAVEKTLQKYQTSLRSSKEYKRIIGSLEKRLKEYESKVVYRDQLKENVQSFKAKLDKTRELFLEKNKRKVALESEQTALQNKVSQLTQTKAQLCVTFVVKDAKKERNRLREVINQQQEIAEKQLQIYNDRKAELKSKKDLLEVRRFEQQRESEHLETFEVEFKERLKVADFETILKLEEAILPISEASRIEAQQKQVEKEETELNKSLSDNQQALEVERAKALTESNKGEVRDFIQAKKKEEGGVNQEIGAIKNQLREDELLKIKYQALTEKIGRQTREWKRWEKLNELIGSAKGDKFRKFAQGLTLAKLVQLANIHLQKLNPRYLVQKCKDDEKSVLELEIMDVYQADTLRSMRTLSGGESFLVSLSLALGLSDLAGKKAQIESLFIDEGFGTLDSNTLDIAMTTLENLQASGKTIGIISHVEALKERIATQIQVKKLSGGYSTIEVIEN